MVQYTAVERVFIVEAYIRNWMHVERAFVLQLPYRQRPNPPIYLLFIDFMKNSLKMGQFWMQTSANPGFGFFRRFLAPRGDKLFFFEISTVFN